MEKFTFKKMMTATALIFIAFLIIFSGLNKNTQDIHAKPDTKPCPIKQKPSSAGQEQLNSYIYNGKPSVLFFTSQFCRDCQDVKPIIKELEKKYEDKINFITIDVRATDAMSKEAIKTFRVLGVPLTIFLNKKGSKEKSLAGSYPQDSYETLVEKLLK
jgi:thiol-disulfide isomerase/thioredoxin